MFGRKKKQEESKPNFSDSKKKIEILNKNIDIDKLTLEIETFLKKNDDPFDYSTYTIHEFPEDKLKVFKIEYGMRSPTLKFFVALIGDGNNLLITDNIPENLGAIVKTLLISGEFDLFTKLINKKAFYNKLWGFIEYTVKSLEN